MLLIDEQKIYVKDYQEILYMDENQIIIDMKKYCLNIQGRKLEVFYCDYHEIRINGEVKVVEYVTNRV